MAYLAALSLALWASVMSDLLQGDKETRLWLDTGQETAGFLWWCEVTDKEAGQWRAYMLGLWDMRDTPNGKRALQRLRATAT